MCVNVTSKASAGKANLEAYIHKTSRSFTKLCSHKIEVYSLYLKKKLHNSVVSLGENERCLACSLYTYTLRVFT